MVLAAVSFNRGICHICIMHCKLFQRFSSPHLFIHSRHDIADEMMMPEPAGDEDVNAVRRF